MRMRFPTECLDGVAAMLPTPSTPGAELPEAPFSVDLEETGRAVKALMTAGASAIITNGSLGEMATLSFDEWKAFNEVVLSTARGVDPAFPVFVGVTMLSTRETIERAKIVHQLGGRGIFVGRPFWCALAPAPMLSFYRALAEAVPDMSIVLYDNPEAFKGPIPTAVYAELAKIPQVVGVKYALITPKFAADVHAVKGRIRVMPIEADWLVGSTVWAEEVPAAWSSTIVCGPEPVMALKSLIRARDWEESSKLTRRILHAYEPFLAFRNFPEFVKYNIVLEKVRFDEAGFIKAGPARHPHNEAPAEYISGAREMALRWVALCEEIRHGQDGLTANA